MTRKFFSISIYSVLFCVILFAVLATLFSYLLRDLKHYTELSLEVLEKRTGYTVSLDDIHWSFTRGAGVRIDNLEIPAAA